MSDSAIPHLDLRGATFALRDAPVPPRPLFTDTQAGRRRKIWDISPTLHCSIIGTCLTAAQLRQLFVKLGHADAKSATDHALHGRGVTTAGQRDVAAKQLHKMLDRRHETAIKRFAKATTIAEIRKLWLQALDDGAIPDAYWAVLTHPLTDRTLVQEVFGEVHMLSHLVGMSNRIDIARLRNLEREIGERDARLDRQQIRLQAAARERDELLQKIQRLEADLAGRSPRETAMRERDAGKTDTLRRKLDDEKARSTSLTARLADAEARLKALEKAGGEHTAREIALRNELAAFEKELTAEQEGKDETVPDLRGRRLLYVGGRPGQVDKLRAIAERRGGELLAHDGGVEDSAALLPGLVSQADIAFFPVDCVSHKAAGRVKKLCRDSGKTFVPLRTASLASFVAAIRNNDLFDQGRIAAG